MLKPVRPQPVVPRRRRPARATAWTWTLVAALAPAVAAAASAEPPTDAPDGVEDPPVSTELDDLLELGFEDLLSMDVEVTSTTRTRGVRLAQAPGALYLIKAEEIARSGLSTLPELLRLAPGLHVGRLDANTWGIGARGFNSEFSRELLVLRDGRTLYTPTFAGVYWDVQDTVLEDLDRIEVIRGPGGALWGANAMNGVINITSKSAEDTLGTLVATTIGDEEFIGTVRHGGRIDDETAYRVFLKSRWGDDGRTAAGDAADENRFFTGGFRIDRAIDPETQLTLQGESSYGRFDEKLLLGSPPALGIVPLLGETETAGAHLLARWTRTSADDRVTSMQAYVDWYGRDMVYAEEDRVTLELEAQTTVSWAEAHRLTFGGRMRLTRDDIASTPTVTLAPASRTDALFSLFVQDTWEIDPTFRFISGTKVEHNDYTGIEVQPSVRFVWTPSVDHTVWGAVSRAVRTPSRGEEDVTWIFATLPGPTPAGFTGNGRLDSETLVAYELGWRHTPSSALSVDLSVYHNRYEELIPFALGALQNSQTATAYGGELATTWRPVESLALVGTYSIISLDVDGPGAGRQEVPRHAASLRAYATLTDELELNAIGWYGERYDVQDSTTGRPIPVPTMLRLDANLVWRPRPGAEFAVGVRNALDPQQLEYSLSIREQVEIERTVYARVRLEF